MRLPEKQLFSLPVTLDIPTKKSYHKKGEKILLTYEGKNVAVLEIEDCYRPNKVLEAKQCYGTSSCEHPNVEKLMGQETGK
jgi:sulfate adenylyltransferase